MFDILKRQDWWLYAAVLFLIIAGLLVSVSISRALFWQQIIWLAIGIITAVIISLIDWRPLITYRWLILLVYLLSVGLLAIVSFIAPPIRHVRSWLVLGPVQFQVSEFAKVALIILLAYFFSRRHVGIAHFKNLIPSFIYLAVPAFFILRQPDLGSAMILFCIWAGFLLVSGIPWRHLLVGVGVLIIGGVLAWSSFLRPYQKERIVAFLNPAYDPLGVNYGVIQSKIAIGSAGFFGKGFEQGTQLQLGFLPEAQADFVVAAFIEEWGLSGGLLVVAAFGFLLLRIIRIGFYSQNNFFRLLCLGTAVMFLAQFIFNIGSALGLLPVVGVTFPFLSYGGSSLLMNMVLIGIIESVAARTSFLRI